MPSDQVTVIVNIHDDHSTPQETQTMAEPIDLPSNVAAAFLASSVASVGQTASNSRDVASLASGTLQAGIVATQNLLGTTTVSRAVSGVIATPIAGPTDSGK